jgi:hypothetical protein
MPPKGLVFSHIPVSCQKCSDNPLHLSNPDQSCGLLPKIGCREKSNRWTSETGFKQVVEDVVKSALLTRLQGELIKRN